MALVLLALCAWSPQHVAILPAAPQPPPPPPAFGQSPRDTVPRAEPKGTAVIRGRVIAADTGLPIRRANVNLTWMQPVTIGSKVGGGVVTGTMEGASGGSVGMITSMTAAQRRGRAFVSSDIQPRSTRTDDQGNFEFTALPAGSYRIHAAPAQYSAQYLPLGSGTRRTNADPGLPIELSDGQIFDKATIALPRGAVIVGRVTNDSGEPMARVPIVTLYYPPGSPRAHRTGGGFAQTDDLGQFRLFGLEPGEYAVVAEGRMVTFMPPNVTPSDSDEDRNGFLTTYYPATPDEASAQRVRTRAGIETSGIEIRMSKGRLYRVSGLVIDSQGNPMARTTGQIVRTTTTALGIGMSGFSTDEQGRFQMQNMASGNYRLIVRQRPQTFGPNGPEGDPGEMATVPLTISGADVENLTIVTSPSVTVSGRIEYEPVPPEHSSTQVRVDAVPSEPEFGRFGPPPSATVQEDLSFKLKHVSGEYVIRAFGFPGNYYLKAVLVGGTNISDTPREFKPRDHVTLVVSSRAATLEGTVTDAKGTPTSDAGIIVFPDDKASWRATSMRVHRSSPDAQGHYRISPMHPGRYFILATDRGRLDTFAGVDYAAFYEELSKDATTLIVNEDETRTVDLKVVASGGQ